MFAAAADYVLHPERHVPHPHLAVLKQQQKQRGQEEDDEIPIAITKWKPTLRNLHIRGVENVSSAIAFYQAHCPSHLVQNDKEQEPAGYLFKSDRTVARYFRLIPRTPILVYRHSLNYFTNNELESAAIDLAMATDIFLITNSHSKRSFLIQQLIDEGNESVLDEIELTAPSFEAAQHWVELLKKRMYVFNALTGVTRSTKSSNIRSRTKVLSIHGRQLLREGLGLASRSDKSSYLSAASAEESASSPTISRYYTAQEGDWSSLTSFSSVPSLEELKQKLISATDEGVDQQFWGAVQSMDHISLRGQNYMEDRRKVKAHRSLMELVAVDVYSTGPSDRRIDHVAAQSNNRMFQTRPNQTRPPYTWVVVYQIPGSHTNFALAMYFCPTSLELCELFQEETSEERFEEIASKNGLPPSLVPLLREFFFGEDNQAFRDDRFKMIPYIRDGPFLVRNAVPSKPALIGRRMPIRYFKGDGYLEMDIDIGGGTKTAKNLTQLAVGYSSAVVFDVAFLLEGRDQDELPEEILAMASIRSIDLKASAVDLSAISNTTDDTDEWRV